MLDREKKYNWSWKLNRSSKCSGNLVWGQWSNLLNTMVKHTETIRRMLPTNCLSVFHHFVGLALKGLRLDQVSRANEKVLKVLSAVLLQNINTPSDYISTLVSCWGLFHVQLKLMLKNCHWNASLNCDKFEMW